MMRLLLAAVMASVAPSSSPDVSEQDTVQRLAAEAAEAFTKGDYRRAARRLQRALVLEPDNPALIYGLAQARRGTNDCEEAIALYDRFLRSGPTERQRADAIEGRTKCKATTPPPDPDPPPSEPVVDEPAPPSDLVEPADGDGVERRPSRVGPALVGVGAALSLTGAGLVVGAFVGASRAPASATQDEYLERSDRAAPLAIAGWSLVGVGASALVAGAITWALHRRRGVASARAARWSRWSRWSGHSRQSRRTSWSRVGWSW